MSRYVLRRIAAMIPVLFGILLVVFVMVRLIPGDPCLVMLGERATKAQCEAFKERFGLHDPLPVQFVRYTIQILQGDLGTSISTGRPVAVILAERLPMTIELTIGAILFATTVGITLGILSAIHQNSPVDVMTMVLANIGVSMPVFWLGLMLAYVFALVFKDTPLFLPPSGRLSPGITLPPLARVWGLEGVEGFPRVALIFLSNSVFFNSLITGNIAAFWDAVRHLILPSVAVGTIPLSIIARMTRSSLLEVLGEDYIRTARAKGLRERIVLARHAMRNAMIPIVTVVGLQTGSLLSGAVLTETVFALPGVGTQLVSAILARDYPVVQGFTLAVAIMFALVNLIVDLSYAYLDPRIRLE
ncbi:Dipeptide transport system permease protein DppB [Candidatus Thermoflexus japonica]|uniref:Dipeptide transport system permease protein DppB n=1 Tax=Candidatus Thermoflexus japonica TaxID=2035417 RepID=A0A2H5Y6V9_9CHLR|nr:Dipeptide transport system permease protein DppB [Candidatus Thermoflexus japonica]